MHSDEEENVRCHPVFEAHSKLSEAYECGESLGTGAFAEVRRCIHRESGEERAIKIVDKKRFALNPELREGSWVDEVDILKTVDHPSVVKVLDVFNTRRWLCIVMELIRGGDLFDAVVSVKCYPERTVRYLFRQMCDSLKYLHDRDIIHRDLKPENFLVIDNQVDLPQVKMGDFGLAKVLGDKTVARTLCGTPHYLAPEVLEYNEEDWGGYGKPVDVWALGCVLYILFVGFRPFRTRQDIVEGNYRFSHARWKKVSVAAKDLIRNMLVVDPENRYTIEQCLEHEWMKGDQ